MLSWVLPASCSKTKETTGLDKKDRIAEETKEMEGRFYPGR